MSLAFNSSQCLYSSTHTEIMAKPMGPMKNAMAELKTTVTPVAIPATTFQVFVATIPFYSRPIGRY